MKAFKFTDSAKLPTRKHSNDAGLDLYSTETVVLHRGEFAIVKTGVGVELPKGTVGILKAKSKSDFVVGAGVVDEGYRGELMVKVFNPTRASIRIREGDPLAQLVVLPVVVEPVEEVTKEEVSKSDRGATGGIVSQSATLKMISADEAEKFMEE